LRTRRRRKWWEYANVDPSIVPRWLGQNALVMPGVIALFGRAAHELRRVRANLED
jgi:hypothetical protein